MFQNNAFSSAKLEPTSTIEFHVLIVPPSPYSPWSSVTLGNPLQVFRTGGIAIPSTVPKEVGDFIKPDEDEIQCRLWNAVGDTAKFEMKRRISPTKVVDIHILPFHQGCSVNQEALQSFVATWEYHREIYSDFLRQRADLVQQEIHSFSNLRLSSPSCQTWARIPVKTELSPEVGPGTEGDWVFGPDLQKLRFGFV